MARAHVWACQVSLGLLAAARHLSRCEAATRRAPGWSAVLGIPRPSGRDAGLADVVRLVNVLRDIEARSAAYPRCPECGGWGC